VLYLTVDWACLPREGKGLDIAKDLDARTVESVGCDLDGHPTVYVGRVALDDIQVAQLGKAGWRMTRTPRDLPWIHCGVRLRVRHRGGSQTLHGVYPRALAVESAMAILLCER